MRHEILITFTLRGMGETMRRQAMVIATALLLAGTAMAATQDSSEAAAVHTELWPAAKSPAALPAPATAAPTHAPMQNTTPEQKLGTPNQGDTRTQNGNA